MKIEMRPNRDRIVVQDLKEPDTFRGTTIVTPDTAKRPRRGVVLAVGPGLLTANGVIVPLAYEPADVVLYSQFAGTEIQVLDVETDRLEYVRVLRDDEILGSTPPEPVQVPSESFEEFRDRMRLEGLSAAPGTAAPIVLGGQAPTASVPPPTFVRTIKSLDAGPIPAQDTNETEPDPLEEALKGSGVLGSSLSGVCDLPARRDRSEVKDEDEF